MRNFHKMNTLILIAALAFVLFACEYLEETVNEATKQTKNFTQDLEPGIPIKGMAGACSPTINFDTLLSVVPIWNDVKANISEVNINAILYTVDPNSNSADGKVRIYITSSGNYFIENDDPPPQADQVGVTDVIEAEKIYEEQELLYLEGGQERLENLMMNFDTPFSICAEWTGDKEDVDMTFLLSVDIDVVFVPLT